MDYAFEKEKNVKATIITSVITVILFSIFFYVHYSKPVIPEPVIREGIEVNLGNSETGLGNIAPLAPGEAAPETKAKVTPTQNEPNKPIAENTNTNEEDVTVNKPTRTVKKITPNNTPTEKPIPTPKPKAIFTGTKPGGAGGNNADSYNKSKNQGIAGGKGDQGNPNGNPNSDSYTGNAASGNSGNGVTIRNGLDGRRITKLPSFEDDFNENAKVAVDITVDRSGAVTTATINPRGTTTTNINIKNIALRKARSLKLNSAKTDEQTGTLVFSFRLRN